MHFRTPAARPSPTCATSTKKVTEDVTKHPAITAQVSEPESPMEILGISCWDFAYEGGKCTLPPTKNCCLSKSPNPKHHEKFIAQTVAPAYDVLRGEQPQGKSKKHSKHAGEKAESRTYLLSSPTPMSITYPQTKTTISSLLASPNMKLVYLVPQSNIVCPKVCELMRLPRAANSSFQVLPVPPEIEMVYGGKDSCSMADDIGVQEVVAKVLKNTKTRKFDGFIAFEEEREAWTFLERVGKGVQSAAKKG